MFLFEVPEPFYDELISLVQELTKLQQEVLYTVSTFDRDRLFFIPSLLYDRSCNWEQLYQKTETAVDRFVDLIRMSTEGQLWGIVGDYSVEEQIKFVIHDGYNDAKEKLQSIRCAEVVQNESEWSEKHQKLDAEFQQILKKCVPSDILIVLNSM